MEIPKAWTKVEEEGELPDGRRIPLTIWGWGDDEASARTTALERLGRVLERLRRGQPFPEKYRYARPLKEEILHVHEEEGAVLAIVTRNAYGAMVLNTARLLFLDVDLEPGGLGSGLKRLFRRGPSPEEQILERLRATLAEQGRASFRIYRTAAGFRAVAVDREFEPTGEEAQALMRATGTDPRFALLCRAQKCFRARLTPKPWRCYLPRPPRQFPRTDPDLRRRFELWLAAYEAGIRDFATCRLVATVGAGRAQGPAARLIDLHDRLGRCDEDLPLA